MQVKVFSLPVLPTAAQEEEVNKFLRSHRVMTVDRHFTPENGGYWTLLVTYQDFGSPEAPAPVQRGSKKDYRELLGDDGFALFARFKDIRRDIARSENIPAYAVFTDDELAQIVQLPDVTVEGMRSIKGVGKRAEKYGMQFVAAQLLTDDEASGGLDG